MNADYTRLRELVVGFADFQKPLAEYSENENAVLAAIGATHAMATRTYLEATFSTAPTKARMSDDNRYIYLTPFEEHAYVFLPLLSVDIDLTEDRPKIAIHALHYGLPKAGKIDELKCFAYRYDSPNWTTGRHNFYHVQFSWGHDNAKPNQRVLKWISRKDPSLPIDATSCTELFLCAVTALRSHGAKFRDYYDEWAASGVDVNDLLKPMAMTRWRS